MTALAERRAHAPRPYTSATPFLSIVLPARNEAADIRATVRAVHDFLSGLGLSFEIILGDSASTDGTATLALGTDLPELRVVRANLPGKGLVLSRAMLCARGAVIGFIDSDLEIAVQHLGPAIAAVLDGADAGIGSKILHADFAHARTPVRRATTQIANKLIRCALRTTISDHQAGMKVFRREALLPALRRVRATGWLWDTELLARLSAAGATIREIPVKTETRRPSRLRSIRQVAGAAWELAALCIDMRLKRRRTRQPTLLPVR